MRTPATPRPRAVAVLAPAVLAVGLVAGSAHSLQGQTEYRDAEAGTPVRIEDAVPTERSAVDVSLATLRFERLSSGASRVQVEPRLAFGVAPRAEVSFRLPLAYRSDGPTQRAGAAGIGIGRMYALNVETQRLPAVALAAEAFLPAGSLSAGMPAYAAKLAITRSFPAVRLHVNASYGRYGLRQPGPADSTCAAGGAGCGPPLPPIDGPCAHVAARVVGAARPPRAPRPVSAMCLTAQQATGAADTATFGGYHPHWLTGVAADHTLPFRSVLLLFDVFAERFEGIGRPVDWVSELGARAQLTPRLVAAGALGRHFLGAGQSWFVSIGLTFVRAGPLVTRTPRAERAR